MKKWWQLNALAPRAQGQPQRAELLVYGVIGSSWWEESVIASELVRTIAQLDVGEILVRINSMGGSVSDGIAIHNALRAHGAKIVTRVEGTAASIASLIAMAGDEVEMFSNALLMIHAPWAMVAGNASDLRDFADVLDKHADAMASSYMRRTGQSRKEAMALLTDGKDHWFTAEEAKAESYASLVLDTTATDAPADKSAAEASFRSVVDSAFPDLSAQAAGALAAQRLNPLPVAGQINSENSMRHMRRFPFAALMAMLSAPAGADGAPAAGGGAPAPAPAAETPAQIEARLRADVVAKETTRREGITGLFANAVKVGGDVKALEALREKCLADDKVDVAAAGKEVLALMAKNAEPIGGGAPGAAYPVVTAGQTDKQKRIEAQSEALLARMGRNKDGKPVTTTVIDGANPYRGFRLNDFARASLENAGRNCRGMSNEEIAAACIKAAIGSQTGSQSTSDFPVVLENTMHKLLLTGFLATPVTWNRIAKIGDVSDFRQWKRIVPGLMGSLDVVGELGEYKTKVIPDGVANPVQVTRKGNILAVSIETIVNDDLGAISEQSNGLGMVASRTIEKTFYVYLESNPVMTDGQPLFSVAHANLSGSSDAITVAALDAGAIAMAKQTAPGLDAEFLDIRPAVGLANTSRRGDFTVVVGSEYDPDANNKLQRPNKVRNIVGDIVVTPRIALLPWYLFADPNVAPVIEVVFLNGQRGPRLTMDENFNTSGWNWKVEMPFGVGAIDYRGGWKNPGA